MPSPLNINNITPPRVPLTDPRTGLISREWYRFFLNLFKLTGEGSNAVSLDDLQIGPPRIPSDAIQIDPNDPTNSPSDSPLLSQIDEIDKQLNALKSQSDTLAADLNAEAQKQIDGLEATPPDQAKNFNAEAQKRFDGLESAPPNEAQDLNSETQKSINALQIVPQPPLGTMAQLQQADLPWVTFNTAPDFTPPTVGTVAWDGGTTLGVQATSNVLIRVGEAEYVYVKASSAVTKGQVCYHTGSVGASGVITVAPTPLALADPNQIIGIAAESIALNGFGLIQFSGTLRGFDTTGSSVGEIWLDGDALYYNPAYVGSMTNVKPIAPNQKTYLGEVINAATAGSGSMNIRLSPGSTLGGTDSNVQFGTLTDKDLIQYDSTAQYWKNVSPSTVTVGTATNLAGGAAGSVPYQTGAGATTFLGIGSALQVLKVNAGATAPEWVSGAALTKTDDTNVTLTLGGTPATSLLAATSLTLGWTGQLSLTRGGTNASLTASAGSVAYSTASALALNTAGNSGDWLKSAGTSAPAWTAPAALTKTDDTNVTLTLGGSASTALLNAASLTLGWTGQLAVSRGGTGVATTTANYVFAGPTSGGAAAPSFRALVSGDIPSLSYVSSVSGTAPIVSSGGLTPAISITQATTSTNGYLSSTDWNTFNNKQSVAAPVTKTADFTVAATDLWLINNKSGSTCTVTLPAASSFSGRVLHFLNYQAYTVVSASSNVVPLTGGAAGTAILAAVAGDTATLVSDGTNWIMTQYVPNNVLLLE